MIFFKKLHKICFSNVLNRIQQLSNILDMNYYSALLNNHLTYFLFKVKPVL